MKKYFAVLVLMIVALQSNAQCAMCKAVVESNQSSGLADGLNSGIIYLMFFPYLLIGGVAYLMYRHRKKSRINTH